MGEFPMQTEDGPARGHPPILPSDMGEMRTIMAADRTLMAWIRTSLSMVSFGFTLYKFLQGVAAQGNLPHEHSPRRVGLILVGMGVAAMLLGTINYWTTLKDLQRAEQFRLGRPVLLMALLMSLAAVGLFVSIVTRAV